MTGVMIFGRRFSRAAKAKFMKQLLDVLKGRPIGWLLSQDISRITGRSYGGGDRLFAADRSAVEYVIEVLKRQGIKPATSLLTPMQRKALAKKKRRPA